MSEIDDVRTEFDLLSVTALWLLISIGIQEGRSSAFVPNLSIKSGRLTLSVGVNGIPKAFANSLSAISEM